MRHPAAHRWADLEAGRVDDAAAAAMSAHADACARCARVRGRVSAGRAAFADLRAATPPPLAWDEVRTRVHWEVSSAQRSGAHHAIGRRRGWPWLGAGVVVAAAVGGIWLAREDAAPAPPVVAGVIEAAPDATPTAAPIAALVTLAAEDANVDGATGEAALAKPLGAGARLRAGAGALAVQFGERSAFALAPGSELEIRRFDEAAIELAVRGRVDVEVSARKPGQRFVIHADGGEVEVRGTQFRVDTDDGLDVRCAHGAVTARLGGRTVEIGAAEGWAAGVAQARRLAPAEVAELALARPFQLPSWSEPAGLAAITAPLSVEGVGEVRLDGASVGPAAGALVLRVHAGRHLVELRRGDAWQSLGWVEVAAGQGARLRAEPSVARAAAGAGVRARRAIVAAHDAALRACIRAIEKQGLYGTFVELEVTVDADGVVNAANVIDSDLPAVAARCVRTVVAGIDFGAGAAVTWRQRLEP